MNIIIAILLIVYTLLHVVFKFGGLLWIIIQIYILKKLTISELKEKNSLFKNEWVLWYSALEHVVMCIVFIYCIIVLL